MKLLTQTISVIKKSSNKGANKHNPQQSPTKWEENYIKANFHPDDQVYLIDCIKKTGCCIGCAHDELKLRKEEWRREQERTKAFIGASGASIWAAIFGSTEDITSK